MPRLESEKKSYTVVSISSLGQHLIDLLRWRGEFRKKRKEKKTGGGGRV